jgi:hypothetical protein
VPLRRRPAFGRRPASRGTHTAQPRAAPSSPKARSPATATILPRPPSPQNSTRSLTLPQVIKTDPEHAGTLVAACLGMIRLLAALVAPYVPSLTDKILAQLALPQARAPAPRRTAPRRAGPRACVPPSAAAPRACLRRRRRPWRQGWTRLGSGD